tara:strand:+ start:262 stop:453 length:192 start_codon:yes stop_codon:yes gene_type:complete
MSKDKATKFDGISRPSNDLYRKNYDSIFNRQSKNKTNKMLEKYKEQLTDVKQYQENLTESEEK